jgi:hypothetical protein
MRHLPIAFACIAVALTLTCAAGAWSASRPSIAPFLAPGATEIQVREIGWGRREITYTALGERYAWYFAVASRLESSRWLPPDRWGPREQINTYTQVKPFWVGYVWEQVDLHGEPNHARITVRRWFYLPGATLREKLCRLFNC